jgi:NADH-quinone oxidoreductase subunit H
MLLGTTTLLAIQFTPNIAITLLLIIHTLLIVLLGGALTLLERKYLALIQRRVGPNVVGFRGRLQFIADALKIFLKETIFLKNINSFNLVLLPNLYLFINLVAPFGLVWGNNVTMFSFEYDLMFLVFILAASNMVVVFTGLVLRNKYTQMSANRAAVMATNMDISMGFFISYLVSVVGSFHFGSMLKLKYSFPMMAAMLPTLLPLFFIILMDLGKAPFDLVEAETELIMGFHSDYSGFLFVLFLLGEYLHMMILGYFFGLVIL